MTDPEVQLPTVLPMLRSLTWRYTKKLGGSPQVFEEIMSEAYIAFMNVCESFDESRNIKFSTWVHTKVDFHLKTWMRKRYRDHGRISFHEDIVDEMLPPSTPVEFRNSIMDQIKTMTPEAQKMIRHILDSDAESVTPKQLLRDVCDRMLFEDGIDRVYSKMIIHEIAATFGK